MKIPKFAALSACVLFAAGCVTEGGLSLEPASDDEQARANLALGIGYLQEGRPNVAIESLQRALDAEPRLADAHSAIAVAYDQTDETELAEQHHRRAARLAPTDPIVQNAFAVFLCRQDRWDEAEPYFDRAIDNASNGRPDRYQVNAATCALAADDFAVAETQFRSALDIDPNNVDALRGMVDVSLRTSNFLQGRAFWQRLERNAMVESSDLLSCFVIESELGDEIAAGNCAERLRREFPGSQAVAQLRELERNGS